VIPVFFWKKLFILMGKYRHSLRGKKFIEAEYVSYLNFATYGVAKKCRKRGDLSPKLELLFEDLMDKKNLLLFPLSQANPPQNL
jgi:hypothetical protein